MRYLTLNNKILLLLISSILLVLILVGTVFSIQITRLYESSARAELISSADLVRTDMLGKTQRLIENCNRSVQDENILATLNLISRYQDVSNYQALVFDPEKRKLVSTLKELLHVGGFNMASVYLADGGLIAFYSITEKSEAGGYLSYENGEVQFVPINSAEETGLSSNIYHGFSELQRHQQGSRPVIKFRAEQGVSSVVLEATIPFTLPQAGASELVIGWLRLSYYLDQSYLSLMAQKLNMNLAFISDAEHISSNGFTPEMGAHDGVVVPVLHVTEEVAGDIAWIVTSSGFEAHLALPLDGHENIHLVLGEGAGDLVDNLNLFARSIFWVMLLAGVLVAPLGLYFTRRWVTSPIQLLTDVARDITTGEQPKLRGLDQHDELGVLAEAFVVMSSAIINRENELRDKQRQFEGIISNAPAVIYMKDVEGRYLLVNSLFEKLFSVTNEGLRGKTDSELFEKDVVAAIRANEERVFKNRSPIQVEEIIPQGEVLHTYLSVKFPLFDDDHNVIAVCGISTDITERKRTENDLMLAKNIIENAHEGVVVTTLGGVITDVNEAYEHITGYTREEVLGLTPAVNQSGRHDKGFYQVMWESIARDGFWQGEVWDRRKNGEVYPKWLSINTVRGDDDEPTHYVGIFSDITSKKATEEQLEKLAYFDALTDLPNRLLFRDRLNQEIAAARRHENKVALFFLDLDRFKNVNDTLGHAAGDDLLQIVAQRLQENVRESDTVSRLGGDEFTVIIPDIEHADEVSGVAQSLIDELGKTMHLNGREVHIGASVGVAVFPEDGDNIDQLSRHADMAMYKAKEEGRNNFQFFSAELQTHIAERVALEDDLRKGLQRDEFLLYYQPKYDLATDTISGMESLVRWQQPERGMVSPVDFIPLAEETGLIIPMGEWILREACVQTAGWNKSARLPLKIAVNLSARQFQQKDLVEMIKRILDESGLAADSLELELTESMVMGDVEEAILTMRALRDLGLSLAIDDFGTGYSSLSYLKRFPINTLKIDQTFVHDLTTDSDDASIVQAIIAMGRQLDMHVVAEGVDTREQLEFLRQHGCEEVQGYLLSRPIPTDDFTKLIGQ